MKITMTSRFKRYSALLIGIHRVKEWFFFIQRNFDAPYPTFIKRKTLTSHSEPNSAWIETGTYMGSMSLFLAKRFPKIITIEPSKFYFDFSQSRLKRFENVEIIFGSSEENFEQALLGEKNVVNIWLDGHFSEGGTFLGQSVSPIIHELDVIGAHKNKFNTICVFVDDVRLFQRYELQQTEYPPFVFLLDWASQNGFCWEIQNDIFIAKYRS